jgi:hypothetical protein
MKFVASPMVRSFECDRYGFSDITWTCSTIYFIKS